ncbi:MAG TPA: 4-(cytidine 5'-diphospho)-2-C-methyl-D-erythritol kinase, partial [Longimicrobium sp.]|nr:4-(cytidine 5'-diphospho)-2-C-methyl-D-erythritol kinase [Longimicrobium sp.]
MAERVEILAPAKVNLRLSILAREESGYHALETVFCAISLADTVVISRGGAGIRLSVEGGVDTGPPEKNLAVRAADRFYRELGEDAGVDIHLTKRIPSQAGLGGGSSDAAAVLRALNALHDDPLPRGELLQLAIELGADVPFFLCGSPLALAWGRGERLMPLTPLPSRPMLVAHPRWPMSTANAFAQIAQLRGGAYHPRAVLIDLADLRSWTGVASIAMNEFELVAVDRGAIEVMRSAGAFIALLAGSGSSVFGIFETPVERDSAALAVRGRDLGGRTWRAETLTA